MGSQGNNVFATRVLVYYRHMAKIQTLGNNKSGKDDKILIGSVSHGKHPNPRQPF